MTGVAYRAAIPFSEGDSGRHRLDLSTVSEALRRLGDGLVNGAFPWVGRRRGPFRWSRIVGFFSNSWHPPAHARVSEPVRRASAGGGPYEGPTGRDGTETFPTLPSRSSTSPPPTPGAARRRYFLSML